MAALLRWILHGESAVQPARLLKEELLKLCGEIGIAGAVSRRNQALGKRLERVNLATARPRELTWSLS